MCHPAHYGCTKNRTAAADTDATDAAAVAATAQCISCNELVGTAEAASVPENHLWAAHPPRLMLGWVQLAAGGIGSVGMVAVNPGPPPTHSRSVRPVVALMRDSLSSSENREPKP
ncbi:hypothetical protein ZHAS_00018597 [Anopheles sinensis]|uniref:Uncharacterized protein n=1 Tax=Anopheles sinensis TaxID=74873 RepID=A0A084WJD4_ANOSI|nr:hypothetical protein ZHAS_00018597 [Anopheles sinensis]